MKKLIVSNRPLNILLITNSIILLASAMLGPIYALFVEEIGGSLMDASIAGGIFALVASITSLFSGKLADKVDDSRLIVAFGYMLMGVGFLLYFWVNSIITLFLLQALLGFGEAVYSPAFDALYSKHLTWRRGGAQWGVWESARYITTAFGAFAGGLLVTFFGFQTLFILMACLCFGSALFIYILKKNII